MKRSLIVLAWLSVVFIGCGVNQYQVPGVDGHAVFPAKIVSRFESKIPNPYYFWPEGYWDDQRLWINSRFRSMLETYASRRSDAASGRVVDLVVTLEEVFASFEAFGRRPHFSPHRYAIAPGVVVSAAAEAGWAARPGRRLLVHGVSALEGNEGSGGEIPFEVTKTVVLTVTVEIQIDGKQVRKEALAAESSITVMQHEYYEGAYDYDDDLDIAMVDAIRQIDRLLSDLLSVTSG
jgi:hypothetical protein